MAISIASPFTFFSFFLSPPSPPSNPSSSTAVNLSRWNNANAERFRSQEEIERDLRLSRRFKSLSILSQDDSPNPNPNPPNPNFKSNGSPSSPSAPSIPGRRSKYSKPPHHPAFQKFHRRRDSIKKPLPEASGMERGIVLSDKGLSYKLENAPFEFQYSYTETPKVKPLALREQPFLPFGPDGVKRPWTGRRPLPESKKKLPEFDSFKPPPAGKKGVKTVQNPGPFLVGMGPKVEARSREEILGEELTVEEVRELVKGCVKTKRQLNMGRDGLTHNMLDNIHAHWKRRRVCKIKCKGVCTVDMDNVRQQLEEKTGGKIIYSKGGIIFLFRGRNYNYRIRPRYPLMLWKPVTPIYPRLVQRAPEGLTLEEASDMRKRGRKLLPICKLGKNGVYTNLVKNVKEAFEACELARIDCTGLNKSDCRKIGAKLKDLVPCVLISFEYEHILMWRGRDWKSSLPPLENKHIKTTNSSTCTSSNVSHSEVQESVDSLTESISDMNQTSETSHEKTISTNDRSAEEYLSALEENTNSPDTSCMDFKHTDGTESTEDENMMSNDIKRPQNRHLEAVKLLVIQAIESGSAIVLEDDEALDADIVYERSVSLAKTAPPGPVFRHKLKRVLVQKSENEDTKNSEERVVELETISNIPEKRVDKSFLKSRRRDSIREVFLEVVPRGSLGVDELAKLLS